MQDEIFRADGRRASQLRPIKCDRGVLCRADGSARWTQGGTSILVAVHGPLEAPQSQQNPHQAIVEAILQPRSGDPPGPEEHALEAIICQTAQGAVLASLHPRTIIRLVVQVLEVDGSLLACALNAASVALLDAGIPMKFPFAAASLCLTLVEEGKGEEKLLLDPTSVEEEEENNHKEGEEENRTTIIACFAFPATIQPNKDEEEDASINTLDILSCHIHGSTGRLKPESIPHIAAVTRSASKAVAAFMRKTAERAYQGM
jgi:exosome complex component RRP46